MGNVNFKVKSRVKDIHEHITLSKELGFFTVEGDTRICYSETDEIKGLYYKEIWDVGLTYLIKGKRTNSKGFKELYDKLFGENSFQKLEAELTDDFVDEACKVLDKEYKAISNLSNDEAKEYMNILINDDDKIKVNKAFCKDDGNKYMYTSSWLAVKLVRQAKNSKLKIMELNVPDTNLENKEERSHNVVVLDDLPF